MRKTILAFASALILFTAFSCHKDKDDNKVSIIGTWTTVSSSTKTYQGTSTTPIDEETYNLSTDGIETTTFKSDGTLTSTSNGDLDSGTYTYDAGSKKLTLIQDGAILPFDVKTLTSTSLVLHLELSYPDPITSTTTDKLIADATLKR